MRDRALMRAELHHPRLAGNPHDLHEQRPEGRQMLLPELTDRKVLVAQAYSSILIIMPGSHG